MGAAMQRRVKKEKYEKPMYSYGWFAANDARAIAALVDERYGEAAARAYYGSLQLAGVKKFEADNRELIADFLAKSVRARPAFLDKICANVSRETAMLFLTLAIIGALRADRVLDVRDRYRFLLVPGRAERVTVAAMYRFAAEINESFDNYAWPTGAFDGQMSEWAAAEEIAAHGPIL